MNVVNPRAFACMNTNIKQDGMTLRDYYAGQALTGFTSNNEFLKACDLKTPTSVEEMVADVSYLFADAMLKARVKGKGKG